LGAWLGNHLIADHPEIKNHLARFVSPDKITVIPYSADILETADASRLIPLGVEKNSYALIIARPEQENLILEIVRAYSVHNRGMPLVVLGNYVSESNSYHREVLEAAGDEVHFVGAIHGHTVGGTNPSLVEALGAGSPVLAHDNKFNRWVAGDGARYFSSEEECGRQIDILLQDDDCIAAMKRHSVQQIKEKFTWDRVHRAYEQLILEMVS